MNRTIATLFTVLLLTGAGCAPLAERRIPDEVLHDPAARFALTEQLRTRIVSRTRGASDTRYWNEVRPGLRRQLESAGLPRPDTDLLLAEVDQARNGR